MHRQGSNQAQARQAGRQAREGRCRDVRLWVMTPRKASGCCTEGLTYLNFGRKCQFQYKALDTTPLSGIP